MGWFDRLMKGRGKGIDELANWLGITVDELHSVPTDYRTVEIPKRSGGKRTLHVPNDTLKDVQRRIHFRVLRRLQSHPAATGFERGRSIATHAGRHVGKNVVVTMDIEDFFPATHAIRVKRYFRVIGWNREAAAALVRLTTHENGLPQGAPTSPRLSNLVNRDIDAALNSFATRKELEYSRYADDIVFSASTASAANVREAISVTKGVLRRRGYKLHNKRKLHIRRRHQRQVVTGLVVNDGVRLPRETRRWLRAVLHHRETRRTATLTTEQLAGWKGFLQMIATQSE